MKKFFVCVVLSVLLAANSVFAMTFSQPVKIGRILSANMGGFVFENASANNGTLSKHGRGIAYDTGVARFGEGNNSLYFHYRYGDWQKKISSSMLFGSDDKNNTVPVDIMVADVLKINTDEGITLYLIHDSYDLPEENCWTLIGRRKDGIWVKYFDTAQVTKKYFGKPAKVWSGNSIWCEKFKINGTIMIIEYQQYNVAQKKYFRTGEFRFKWDDKAQWFGVEQVVY